MLATGHGAQDGAGRDRLAGVAIHQQGARSRAGRACEFIPLPLLALPAGHLADRLPRRTLLAVATALDAAVIGGLLAFTLMRVRTVVWPFFVLAFGTGIASALGAPPDAR